MEEIKLINLLNSLSEGKRLPLRILFDNLEWRNLSRSNENLIYVHEYLDKSVCTVNLIDYIKVIQNTHMNVLNMPIKILEWGN